MRLQQILAPAIVLGFGLSLSVAAAEAQGNSRGKQQDRERDRVEQVSDWWYGDNDQARRGRGNGAGKVPPGWCQGRGNPHNTRENCGYTADRRNDSRGSESGRAGSYEIQHSEFHRQLDRRYAELAARRPNDVAYQIQLRADKAAEHRRWHERTGTRH
jgi:hypothetical protein